MKKLSLVLIFSVSVFLVFSQDEKEKKVETPIPDPEMSVTKHAVTINNSTFNITAHAGTIHLRDEENKPIALFGFTYYAKDNVTDMSKRPIMFAYNGGPGSSSFWLHMGVLGPKRIVVNDPVHTPAAPYRVVNNPHSVLDIADLVMIDPVGTGLSIPVGKAEFKDFWGVDQDIRSISLFIRQFLIEHGRMNSPKFLLGESYGTFRNAGVMNKLLSQGIALNGVIMVSAVFDLRTLLFPPEDDLPYLVHFPTYAATAWYHNKVPNKAEDLHAFLDEVRSFTENEYMPALYKGDQLSEERKSELAQKMYTYTGIHAQYWTRANLRITAGEFFAELLRDDGAIVGRLDSRFSGVNLDLLSQTGNYDPQSAAISPAYITGFLDYFYGDLKVNRNLRYTTTAGQREGFAWDWKHEGNTRWNATAAINTGIDMASALSKDPNMKVLIMNGIFDIATPFYGVEYTINHLHLPKEIKDNIKMTYYEAGHMMYTHEPSLVKFKEDLAEFVRNNARS